ARAAARARSSGAVLRRHDRARSHRSARHETGRTFARGARCRKSSARIRDPASGAIRERGEEARLLPREREVRCGAGRDRDVVGAKEVKAEERQELRKKSLGVSLRDGEAIGEAIPAVERVMPRVEVKPYKIIAPGAKAKGKVFGVSASYRDIASVSLTEGRFFDAHYERDHAQVAVIGQEVRRKLFGYDAAIGKLLKVNDAWLEVTGMLASEATPGS